MDTYASIENLQKLKVYQLSRKLSKLVWDIVSKWKYVAQKTIGIQWIESTDSISSNIAEGYGRYHFNESINFYYFSRGSLFESHDWFKKAQERRLLTGEQIKQYLDIFEKIPIELNVLIKRTKTSAKEYKKLNK